MNAIIRSLILWLALLVLPFQGFAAAAMLPCAPAQAAPASAHAPMAGMSHHDHAAHHAAGAAKLSHQHAKCGNCAACCVGAALVPAAFADVAPHGATALAIPFAAGHMPSVDPDHPERPPRPERA